MKCNFFTKISFIKFFTPNTIKEICKENYVELKLYLYVDPYFSHIRVFM